ncbi:MAG: endonuclease III domain-containing protein [Syntrophales bacterium]|nr:endonuclease III domain-containing protein [Syntrophales bacterium]
MSESQKIKRWINVAFNRMDAHFGNLHWWPGDSKIEIIVGAILTQNTAWSNVEKAITNLKKHEVLFPQSLLDISLERLKNLIRPAGFYNVKAIRLKNFVHWLYEHYEGRLEKMFEENAPVLRSKLLQIKGIGDETADSILLYAGEKPVFVIDSYTRRILDRHKIMPENTPYRTLQLLFTENLPLDAQLFKQYHALLVETGKQYCNKKPKCESCPLNDLLPSNQL